MATNAELLEKLKAANAKLDNMADETIKNQNALILQLLALLTAVLQRKLE